MNNIIITFIPDGSNSYERKISCNWEIPSDPDLNEIHTICRDFCKLLGFAEVSIDKFFGKKFYEGDL